MRMMVAKQFNGYRGLEQVEAPKPQVTDGSVRRRLRELRQQLVASGA